MIERRVVNPKAGFAEAVVTSGGGRTVHLSGNVGFNAGMKIVPGGVEPETRQTFANLEETLARAGGTREHIIKITAFLVDVKDYPGYASVRQELFAGLEPSSSAVIVAGLVVDARIEIEALAFIPDA